MSSDDAWFKRWGRAMPFGPWSYADVEEMMKEMERDFMALDIENEFPDQLIHDEREEDGSVTKEIDPTFYGYSVTVGPDGKPVIREFGKVRRAPTKEWKEAVSNVREPLVDVVEDEKEVRVVAELPGVSEKDVEVTAEGRNVVISANAPARRYRKELELPGPIETGMSRSTFNNGILEVAFPRRRGGPSDVRTRVD